jgi:hypothetical protein
METDERLNFRCGDYGIVECRNHRQYGYHVNIYTQSGYELAVFSVTLGRWVSNSPMPDQVARCLRERGLLA